MDWRSSSSSSSPPPTPSDPSKLCLYSIIIYKVVPPSPPRNGPSSSGPPSSPKVLHLSSAFDLSSFSFFHRSAVKEHIHFHSRLVASRTPTGSRQRVEFENNLGYCHCFAHPCGLTATVLTTTNYPIRVAFGLIGEALRKFQAECCGSWEDLIADVADNNSLFAQQSAALLQQYQQPTEADKLLKVQKDLEEVKDVMLRNFDELLQRGEKLDDLMKKSEDLSTTSYQFFRQAKRNNQCCTLYP